MGLKLTLAAAALAGALALGLAAPSNAASAVGLATLGATTGEALSLRDTVDLRCYKVCRGPYWRRICETRCEPRGRRFYWYR